MRANYINLVTRRSYGRIPAPCGKRLNRTEHYKKPIGEEFRLLGRAFRIRAIGAVCILYGRTCAAALTGNPLLDEERAADEFYTLRFTLNQISNAGAIQKVDVLQVELWQVCAVFNFSLQFRQILLLNPAAQLKNDWSFTQKLLDA